MSQSASLGAKQRAIIAASIAGALFICADLAGQGPPLPPPAPSLASLIPPAPAGNPPTEAKRVLGKILFWDEQLSSDNTMSCGTCHTPARGGADQRRMNNLGPNGLTGTPETGHDDAFGSPGVFGSDANSRYWSSNAFGFARQATERAAPPVIVAALFDKLFWDGRARSVFIDPQTRTVVLPDHAALESQCVVPLLNDVEMGHYGRTWTEVTEKLAAARPLALASDLPADVQAVLSNNPAYPRLFVDAFGDGVINAPRIAMAIATYERTLIPDQSPWDLFNAGNPDALDLEQRQGLAIFNGQGANCAACHTAPLFSDRTFHNIGVRPPGEDRGREDVTRNEADHGVFRTPSLRNAGLRPSFFHNGVRTTLMQVVQFYANIPGTVRFEDNLDPLIPEIGISPEETGLIVAFLTTGLTDPRVAAATFPFDKPTLWDERETDKPMLVGGGHAGAGGVQPQIIAVDPMMIGSSVRLGLFGGPAGATATLLIGDGSPVDGALPDGVALGSVTLSSQGAGTFFWTIPATLAPGQEKFVQWNVQDAEAVGGVSRTQTARLRFFCPRGGCPGACAADVGLQGGSPGTDGLLDNNDFVVFIDSFFTLNGRADIGKQGGLFGPDGVFDNNDFVVFIDQFFAGCAG